jgi:hypothetical protein
MLTDVGTAAPAASDDPTVADAVEPDAEVSFVTKDLATVLPKAKIAAVVALDEIAAVIRAPNGVAIEIASATPAQIAAIAAALARPSP